MQSEICQQMFSPKISRISEVIFFSIFSSMLKLAINECVKDCVFDREYEVRSGPRSDFVVVVVVVVVVEVQS